MLGLSVVYKAVMPDTEHHGHYKWSSSRIASPAACQIDADYTLPLTNRIL
jgi:hypothetical protein